MVWPRTKLAPRRTGHWAAVVVLLAAAMPQAKATCYLMDANSECAVCWKTTYTDTEDKTGVTTMTECPDGIQETWTKPLPENMFAMTEYKVEYQLKLDRDRFGHTPQGDHDIPHANIHSCIASRGACTPFVSNSPGLATHTEEQIGDFSDDETVSFVSKVQLTEEQYTIIAHVRFFAAPEDSSRPKVKWDVAIGVSRQVMAQVAEVSADSWISTGVAGGMLLLVMSALFIAIRKGKVDMDKILEAIYSSNVTLCADLLLGIGDTTAYTVGVFTIIAPDNRLIQVLPAALFFMGLAWLGTMYNAYFDAIQLYDIFVQNRDPERFAQMISKRLALRTVTNIRRSGRRASIAGSSAEVSLEAHILNEAMQTAKREAMVQLEYANRELRRKRGDVITIISEAIPITAIQCYTMLQADDTQMITILIVLFSSTVFGAKMAGLGAYRDVRVQRDEAEANFQKVFAIQAEENQSKAAQESKRSHGEDLEANISRPKKDVCRRGSLYNYFFDRTTDTYHGGWEGGGQAVAVTSLPALHPDIQAQMVNAHQPHTGLSSTEPLDDLMSELGIPQETRSRANSGAAALQAVIGRAEDAGEGSRGGVGVGGGGGGFY